MAGISARLAHFALPVQLPDQAVGLDITVRGIFSDLGKDEAAGGVEINLELESGCDVRVSRNTLHRILKELADNAMYAMRGQGQISVRSSQVVLAEPQTFAGDVIPAGKYAALTVRDCGPGIDPAELEHVIEPFVTINKQKKARGAGLGLAIVFALVHDCGGYLLLENNSAGGVSATILLSPVSQSNQDDIACDTMGEKSTPSGKQEEFRVLVVDDEEDILNLFKLMLGNAIKNTRIDVACNGHEAIENFKNNHYDVIVMDLHMPVMDGHEAFLRLRDMCGTEERSMPSVVFCTGYVPPDGVRQAVSESKQHTLLHKPVGVDVLVSAVKEKLRGV
jgi:CheY-like chemotaxis protein